MFVNEYAVIHYLEGYQKESVKISLLTASVPSHNFCFDTRDTDDQWCLWVIFPLFALD